MNKIIIASALPLIAALSFLISAEAKSAIETQLDMGKNMPDEAQQKFAQYQKCVQESGDPDCVVNLANALMSGDGVDADPAAGIKILTECAEKGSSECQFDLGYVFDIGDYVDADKTRAIDYYKKAAAQGHARAMKNIGYLYESGDGVQTDAVEAVKWYEKAVDGGNVDAMENLALIYQYGAPGVKLDRKKAFDLWQKGTEMGSYRMMKGLGYFYEISIGMPDNNKRAFELYKKCANESDMPECKINYAKALMRGWGVDADPSAGIKVLTQCADGGSDICQLELGDLYYLGDFVEADEKHAFELRKMAAEQGNAEAMLSIGEMYAYGIGVLKNKTEATKWLELAAESRNDEAMETLAHWYQDGRIAPEQDLKKAFALWKMASDSGSASAQCNLALMYADGLYVMKNTKKAIELMKASCDADWSEACAWLDDNGVQ